MRLTLAATALAGAAVSASGVNNLFCGTCKTIVTDAQNVVHGREAEIQSGLENLCKELPPQFANTCSLIVDTQLPKLVDFLTSTTPDEVCEKDLNICEPASLNLFAGDSVLCSGCKAAVTSAQNFVASGANQEQIQAALSGLCGQLPAPINLACSLAVATELPKVLEIIKDQTPEHVCGADLHVCPEQMEARVLRSNAAVCAGCKFAVNAAHDAFDKDSTQAEIKTALHDLCAKLPALYAGICNGLIDSEYEKFKTLVTEQTADKVCIEELKVCDAAAYQMVSAANVKHFWPQPDWNKIRDVSCKSCKAIVGEARKTADDEQKLKEIRDLLHIVCVHVPFFSNDCEKAVDEVMTKLKDEADSTTPETMCTDTLWVCPDHQLEKFACNQCQSLAGKVSDLVNDGKTVDEIAAYLDSACTKAFSNVPHNIGEAECKLIADFDLKRVVKFLSSSTPDEFCTNNLELCPAPEVDIMITSLPAQNGLSSLACEACTAAVDEVAKLIAASTTEKDIEAALFELCDKLPVLQEQCKSVVSAELPSVLAELSHSADSKQICSETLNWCPKQQPLLFSLSNIDVPTPEEIQESVCDNCKDAVNQVQNFVNSHASRADVQAKLDAVCKNIPIFGKDCDAFVSKYIARIYDELTAEHVCEEQFPVCTQIAPAVHAAECKACTRVTGKVHDLIESNVDKNAILSFFDGVCNHLPIFKTRCSDFVSTKIPDVINKLENQVDPALVCKETKLCESKVAQYLALFL
jgi:hypothetical protein